MEANTVQGLPVDARSYGAGAQILAELGTRRLRLMTNNPEKHHARLGHHFDLDLVR